MMWVVIRRAEGINSNPELCFHLGGTSSESAGFTADTASVPDSRFTPRKGFPRFVADETEMASRHTELAGLAVYRISYNGECPLASLAQSASSA